MHSVGKYDYGRYLEKFVGLQFVERIFAHWALVRVLLQLRPRYRQQLSPYRTYVCPSYQEGLWTHEPSDPSGHSERNATETLTWILSIVSAALWFSS